jgi:hypothetical protein
VKADSIETATRREPSVGETLDDPLIGFGLVLLISLVVGTYSTMQEIDRALGKGALFRLLFERRMDKKGRPTARSGKLAETQREGKID